jgi:hypothetical protein
VKLLQPEDGPFWKRDYQKKWRQDAWERMYDVVSMRCKGQALLSLEELGLANVRSTRKHLKKQFGGASEDVKFREAHFENGMPEKGKKPFYRGIDIEAKLRQMKQEWTELVQMCPTENRATYQYAKECELVKICLKHLRHTEFDLSIKELLNEIKFDRKLARAVGGGGGADDDDANMEDWEYRNYKDGWVPSFEKLRDKLVSSYKEAKYNQHSGKEDSSDKRSIPVMLTKAIMKKAISAMFAPGFGQRPEPQKTTKRIDGDSSKSKCWGCGLVGHKRGDQKCKAEANSLHDSAPGRAKRKFNGYSKMTVDGGPTGKKPDGVCRFFSRNGNCKFGANCKYKHIDGGKEKPNKKMRFTKKKQTQVDALNVSVNKRVRDIDQDEIDELVRGFLTVRLIPREFNGERTPSVIALKTSLVDMESFVYDTGAGEGISTLKVTLSIWIRRRRAKSQLQSTDQVSELQGVREGELLFLPSGTTACSWH